MEDPRERRIAELEAENAELRKHIAELERQLQTVLQRRKKHTPQKPPRQGTPDGSLVAIGAVQSLGLASNTFSPSL